MASIGCQTLPGSFFGTEASFPKHFLRNLVDLFCDPIFEFLDSLWQRVDKNLGLQLAPNKDI